MNYCRDTLNPERLRGYVMAPWIFTIPDNYYGLLDAAWLFGRAKARNYPDEKPFVTHKI